jgi:hypothetical protein
MTRSRVGSLRRWRYTERPKAVVLCASWRGRQPYPKMGAVEWFGDATAPRESYITKSYCRRVGPSLFATPIGNIRIWTWRTGKFHGQPHGKRCIARHWSLGGRILPSACTCTGVRVRTLICRCGTSAPLRTRIRRVKRKIRRICSSRSIVL